MVAPTLLQSIQALSVTEKLSLIATISQMVQDELQNKPAVNGHAKLEQVDIAISEQEPPFVQTGKQNMKALIAELLSRPDPTPDKMLRRGMFQGRIPVDEELFTLAEWHPSDEELAGV